MIDVLSDLFILRGVPAHVRSDNGPEFIAKSVQAWIAAVGAKTAYIAPGSPWENGYVESFNARLRDELSEWRDLLHPEGGADHHRKLASALQHDPPARCARLQTTSAGGVRASHDRLADCARPTGSVGQATRRAEADPALTLNSDHLVGAGQPRIVRDVLVASGLSWGLVRVGRPRCRQSKNRHASWAITVIGIGSDVPTTVP